MIFEIFYKFYMGSRVDVMNTLTIYRNNKICFYNTF